MSDQQPSPAPAPTPAAKPKAAAGAATTTRRIVIGIVAVFAILFIALNTHDTNVDFVFGSTKVSVIWVILLSLALGFALGMLFPLRRGRRGKKS